MSPGREAGWWFGGAVGAASVIVMEWSWQGGLAVQVIGFLLALVVVIGFASIGCYVGGFWDDTKEPGPVRGAYREIRQVAETFWQQLEELHGEAREE